MVKQCILCGKTFEASGRNANRRKYCDDIHYATCEYCGNRFEITSNHLKSGQIPKCCSKECSNKLKIQKCKNTVKSKYGVDNISQSIEFKGKIRKGLSLKSKQIAESRSKTMLDRYGVEYPMQSEELKSKICNTNQQRYGYDNPAKSLEIKSKISKSIKSEECQEKTQETSLQRYGTLYPSQSDMVKTKMKTTCRKRYGVDHAIQSDEIKTKMIQSLYTTRMNDPSIKIRSLESIHNTVKQKYGVDWPCQLDQCRQASSARSTINDKFKQLCESKGIQLQSEYHIKSFSYDFKVVNQNILIEIDPTYTHNSKGNHWNEKGIAVDYHKIKSDTAVSNGLRCIHLFDWDDANKVLDMLEPKQNVYARQCEILDVSDKVTHEFLNLYHLQNTCKGQKVKLGLYYKEKLLQIMTFGKPRYNKRYDWELLRLCTHPQYRIVGGASKLFKNFIINYNPQSIISYCDLSKFTGDIYTQLGMKLLYISPPAKVWSSGKQRITDNLLRQRGFDQLFKTNFGKGTNNEELMLKYGWLPVYDCGQAVYEWESS